MVELTLININWYAVISLLVFSFVLGALWHSKLLFGNTWTTDSKTPYNSDNHGNPIVIFGLSALLHFVLLTGLSILLGPVNNAITGLTYGLCIGLIFITTTIGVTYVFAGRTFRLFLIDAGFYIVLLSLAGLIFGIWK